MKNAINNDSKDDKFLNDEHIESHNITIELISCYCELRFIRTNCLHIPMKRPNTITTIRLVDLASARKYHLTQRRWCSSYEYWFLSFKKTNILPICIIWFECEFHNRTKLTLLRLQERICYQRISNERLVLCLIFIQWCNSQISNQRSTFESL